MKHYVSDYVNFIIRSMKRVINETKPGSKRRALDLQGEPRRVFIFLNECSSEVLVSMPVYKLFSL